MRGGDKMAATAMFVAVILRAIVEAASRNLLVTCAASPALSSGNSVTKVHQTTPVEPPAQA
jgi:hypothetical protein